MIQCPKCFSQKVMADGEQRGVCNDCGDAWDSRPEETAPQLHPDDPRNWAHWVMCSNCDAKYVCEGKGCQESKFHGCGCILPLDMRYPEMDEAYE